MSWWDEKFTPSEIEGNPTASAYILRSFLRTPRGEFHPPVTIFFKEFSIISF